MKNVIAIVLLFVSTTVTAQKDSNYVYLVELVRKVQNDKSLRGTFMYKDYKVNIGDFTQLKTVVGKFIQITWQAEYDDGSAPYMAIYHNTLGYMTRSLFGSYAQSYTKGYKEADNKYCKDDFCVELLTDEKLPCIIQYRRPINQIREIK